MPGPIEMPARPGGLPEPPEEDPRAICPHCKNRIGEVDLRFDVTPAGTLLLTFRCKHCQVFQGHQLVPAEWVFMKTIDPPAGVPANIHQVLADLRRKRGG